jgi:hypothetical protein
MEISSLPFFHRPFASLTQVAKIAKLDIFSFAVERTAKEKQHARPWLNSLSNLTPMELKTRIIPLGRQGKRAGQ